MMNQPLNLGLSLPTWICELFVPKAGWHQSLAFDQYITLQEFLVKPFNSLHRSPELYAPLSDFDHSTQPRCIGNQNSQYMFSFFLKFSHSSSLFSLLCPYEIRNEKIFIIWKLSPCLRQSKPHSFLSVALFTLPPLYNKSYSTLLLNFDSFTVHSVIFFESTSR